MSQVVSCLRRQPTIVWARAVQEHVKWLLLCTWSTSDRRLDGRQGVGKDVSSGHLSTAATHDRLGQGCSRAREVVVIVRMEYFRQTARRQTRSGKGCLKWTRVYGGNPRSSGSELRCKQSAITYLTSLTVLHIVCNESIPLSHTY